MATLLSGKLIVSITQCNNLTNADWGGKSDPYVTVYLDNRPIAETKHITDNLNPHFKESMFLFFKKVFY